ncbi:MAG: N-acetylglucosamine-6-phosphate deacetylase [Armatimonadetes bacterium]|nr:N-acetylglucosamine-6-phosphate deacetylase [Armatimonadota bacterium]
MVTLRALGLDPASLPSRYLIRGARLLTSGQEIVDGAVCVEGSRIIAAGRAADVAEFRSLPALDAGEGILAPGYVDIHVHGGGGADAMDGTVEALATMARLHARHGTTAMLATVATGPWERIVRAVGAVREAAAQPPERWDGAQILGLHLEGPFINPGFKGAHPAEHIRVPTPELVEEIWESAGGTWRLVTLAPERWPAALLRHLMSRGVTVSIGHTAATYEQARAAVDAGARHVTHVFNAMVSWHHRKPGVLGVALTDDRVTAEVIADGIHVHPAGVRLALRAKGRERLVLVTDAVRAAGEPDGTYEMLGRTVVASGGTVALPDGTLAGSALTMARAVANTAAFGGLPLASATALATLNPARVIGADGRKGRLAPGHDADLVVLDADGRVHLTVARGRVIAGLDAIA